ncbi:MAG: methionyl-tRNA formyltransferase [Lachnospiraceae bacterium]|nr:methionyl-tRNA formyltransferase [Lachnospiraceae bacterium]
MKIVFMGTPDLAAEVLDTMMRSGCEVSLAVTQPDRPKGRGRGVIKTPVHECADKWGIPVFSPVRVKRPEAVERLREEAPDLIVVAAFGQILSKEILDLPRFGCVNVHASLLPKYRGAAPIQWAVINGEEKSGVTIMQMDEGLDTGDILLQEEIPLEAGETGESLYNKMAKLGGELLVKALPMIEEGTLKPVKQDDEASTYASMLKKEMGCIDWNMPADKIERLVRGLNSWPGAYTFMNGKMLKIWGSAVTDMQAQGEPGTVAGTDKKAIYVNCKDSVLALTEVQYEGKKRMPVQAFLLGARIEEGQKLTAER